MSTNTYTTLAGLPAASSNTGNVALVTSNGVQYISDGEKWKSQGEFTTGTIESLQLDDLSFNGSFTNFALKVGGSNVFPQNSTDVIIIINGFTLKPGRDFTFIKSSTATNISFTNTDNSPKAYPSGTIFYGLVFSRLPLDSNNALQKSGGTMVGDITFSSNQSFPSSGIANATTSQSGIVSLSSSTGSTSESVAATSKAVKDAKDAADSALPKAGGTMTGDITFNSTQQFDGRDVSADGTKLDGIAASANNYSISSDLLDEDDMTSNSATKAASQQSVKAYVDANTGTTNLSYTASSRELASSTGTNVNLPEATTSAAGLQSSADKTKLDGIETSATADQTGAEIKSAYEGESDTNAFTDADHTKLDGIETSATADQTASEIKTLLQSDKISTTEIADDAVTNAKLNLISTSSVPSLEAKGDGSSQDGYIQLNCSQNSHGVKIKSPPHSANASYTLTLPNNDGDSGQFLKTDGSGSLSWDTVSGGGGGVSQNLLVTLTESIDGSRTDFTMSTTPATAQNLMVSINGVIQKPNAGTTISNSSEGYCISGSTLKFATAPANGSTVFVVAQTAGSGGSVDLSFDDNAKVKLGTGNDLQIYHNSTSNNSHIDESGSGSLVIKATNTYINSSSDEAMIAAIADGSVELYHNASKKFETKSYGAFINGHLQMDDSSIIKLGNSNDLQIYHDGTHSRIHNNTGGLYINVGNAEFLSRNGNEVIAQFVENGAVNLYYDNSRKLHTRSDGINVIGDLDMTDADGYKINLGASSDLQLYHGGTHSYIYESGGGNLVIRTAQGTYSSVVLQAGEENSVACYKNGAVDLFYDSVKKLNTESTGLQFYGNLRADDNCELRLGNGGDLQLYHNGSDSYVNDTGTGKLILISNEFRVHNSNNTEIIIHGQENGEVQLRYDNTIRLATTNVGVSIQGDVRFDNNTWTGECSTGKIQTHGNHMYLQNGGGSWVFRLASGTEPAYINSSGTYSSSDERKKKDITTITSAVDTIKQLVGRSFTWKEDDKKSFGLIAQEVETILPDLVTTQQLVPGETNSDPYKMVNYAALTGHLVEAIKELSAKVAALEGA